MLHIINRYNGLYSVTDRLGTVMFTGSLGQCVDKRKYLTKLQAVEEQQFVLDLTH